MYRMTLEWLTIRLRGATDLISSTTVSWSSNRGASALWEGWFLVGACSFAGGGGAGGGAGTDTGGGGDRGE